MVSLLLLGVASSEKKLVLIGLIVSASSGTWASLESSALSCLVRLVTRAWDWAFYLIGFLGVIDRDTSEKIIGLIEQIFYVGTNL